MLTSTKRVAVLLHGGIKDAASGKTGLAFLRYWDGQITCVVASDCVGESLSSLTGIERAIPIVRTVGDAVLRYQSDTLVVGIAPSGGKLPISWYQEIEQAIKLGMNIVNGLHTSLAKESQLTQFLKEDQWIWDIRQEPTALQLGTAAASALDCLRILTIGTDMVIGKMSTSLELFRAAQQRQLRARFIGTGQAGIMISGDGIPLDAVKVDFASGAVEQIVLKYGADKDILFIEGQGSILHPASTATLPLIRGTQPTHLILVHKAGQSCIRTCPHIKIPPLADVIQVYESLASAGGTFLAAKVVGIALNTFHLDEEEAKRAIQEVEEKVRLRCTDVVRFGGAPLLDAILRVPRPAIPQ